MPGVIGDWRMPSGPGVRVDTAAAAGDRVPPEYDPLVAKILVVDADRDQALDRLARALAETEVSGIQTTLPFHRHMAVDPSFRAGPLPIDWVDEHWAEALRPRREAALEAARWAAAAAVANIPARSTALTLDGSTPWIRAGRQRAIERWPR